MTGTLKARIERLEQPAEGKTGGLVWLMPVPDGEAVPEPESHGGLRIIYRVSVEHQTIDVDNIAPRGQVYRGL